MKTTISFLSLLLGCIPFAQAIPYSFLSFEVPNTVATWAYGINNYGQISGTVQGGRGIKYTNHGFVGVPGLFEIFDVPLATLTEAFRINDAGDIVGRYRDLEGNHGFVRHNGSFSITPEFPIDINNDGSFLLTESPSISPPHSVFTRALGMNDEGQVVGFFVDDIAFAMHGFVGTPNSLVLFDIPGAEFTQLWDINNHGEIVGVYEDDGRVHGFIKNSDGFITLDVPGAYFTQLSGLNDKGQIVGNWQDRDGKTRAFVATPMTEVPEPHILLIMGLGLAGWKLGRRRCKANHVVLDT